MKAISIRQPWAWLVVNGWKNIENRDCRFKHRGPLLIHAGSWMTEADYEACRIFVDGICDDLAMPAPADLPRGGIVGEVVVLDCVESHPSPWFTGPFGLVLDEACQCGLIKWRGIPGLFDVPVETIYREANARPYAEERSANGVQADVRPCVNRSVAACCSRQGYVECREVYYGDRCDSRESIKQNLQLTGLKQPWKGSP
jgi:hypothetical protein